MKNLSDLLKDGVQGRTILMRADLNVPLDGDIITDRGRVEATAPTVTKLSDAGAKLVIIAHLGRPKGEPDPRYSLKPAVIALSEFIDKSVVLAGDVVGEKAAAAVSAMQDGDIVVLENIRFDPRETSKVDGERGALASDLVALVGPDAAFISEGFGVVHRKQASVYDIAKRLPAYAGGLVESEIKVLKRLTENPDRPYVVVLGGSKVSDKLAVIEALLPKVDKLLVGGGMCFTFLAAEGRSVGTSLLEQDQIGTCKDLLAVAGDKIMLPVDIVCAPQFRAEAPATLVDAAQIPDDQMGLDIGPRAVADFSAVIAHAKTIFWNGPMGVFEMPAFSDGTLGLARAIANSCAFSVVGGGDSAAAVRMLDVDEAAFSHISTGGGASLEYLEGKRLPGIEVLEN